MRRLLPLLLVFLLLSGCWDYKDLNKLSIVTGMAFDKAGDGELKVALEIIDRSSSPKKEGLRSRLIEAAGRDIEDALRKAQHGLDNTLYYGAMAVAVFGKDAPQTEARQWLLDNRDVRETVYIIYADKASKTLQTEEDGGIAAYKLRDILDASEDETPLELYKLGGAGNG